MQRPQADFLNDGELEIEVMRGTEDPQEHESCISA
jgi:hypothetical protein